MWFGREQSKRIFNWHQGHHPMQKMIKLQGYIAEQCIFCFLSVKKTPNHGKKQKLTWQLFPPLSKLASANPSQSSQPRVFTILIVSSVSKWAVSFCVWVNQPVVWLNLPLPGKWVWFKGRYSFWPIAVSPVLRCSLLQTYHYPIWGGSDDTDRPNQCSPLLTASVKDGLLTSLGAPKRPWSWIKQGLIGVIYSMTLVRALHVLFTCARLSRTPVPADCPHQHLPHSLRVLRIMRADEREGGAEGYHFVQLDVSPLQPWWIAIWRLKPADINSDLGNLCLRGLTGQSLCLCERSARSQPSTHVDIWIWWWFVIDGDPGMKQRSQYSQDFIWPSHGSASVAAT